VICDLSSDSILLAVGPIETTFQGTTYRTERTTLVAKRAPAAQTNPTAEPSRPTVELPAPSRYSLCREPACWVLVYEGHRVHLKHEMGLHYVSYLLRHPNQALSGATLFSKFHPQSPATSGITQLALPDAGELIDLPDDATLSEENLDQDTQRILAAHKEKAQEFREILQDQAASAADRKFAQERLREIIHFLATQKSTTRDPNTRAARRVRKSIQRLRDHLAGPEAGQPAPDAVPREFADYIEQHMLVPSRRYTLARKGANVRVARGELAGHLIFECPPGHRWSVRP
jgi:hypothetical protein